MMEMITIYWNIGFVFASLSGISTFIILIMYFVSTYNLLPAIGAGWIPSAVVSVGVFAFCFALWPLLILLFLGFLFLMAFELTRN